MRVCKVNGRSAILLVLALFFGSYSLRAQTPTATITGTVADPSGGVVAGATVKVTNVDTKVVVAKETNDTGAFTIINLLPGNYTLSVDKTGFKTEQLPVFPLDVNQTLTQNITLEVGAVSETVTVSSSSIAQMIQSSSTELGTLLDQQALQELPLNGRNFTALLILQPGVGSINTAQGGNGIGSADGGNIGIPNTVVYRPAVNGAGNRSNAFYMDGIIDTDDRGGGWSVPPIDDTIQEVKLQGHNDDPQYGNVLGAVVNIVTKSGTNAFHGAAWDFARSNIFDARNPFTGFCTAATCPQQAKTETPTQLSATPVSPLGYSLNEYGGQIGGAIQKNKTFFFAAFESWHFSQPSNSFVIDPTPQEIAGDFSGAVSPELVGSVNSTKTGITPNQLFNPFAETGKSMAVPFTCVSGTQTPMALQNPTATFGQPGYGLQVAGGTACNVIPSALIDTKLAGVLSAYTASEAKACAFTPNYATAVDNCLDSRQKTDHAENIDARIDHYFGSHDTLMGRAYLLWDDTVSIVPGTTSLAPSPYHSWNIGGAWDHIFTPNLTLSVRGGINARPVVVNQTNPQGDKPEASAGFTNIDSTQGFYLTPGSGYPSPIGNVGPEHRANPEHDFNATVSWSHGRHNFKFGGEYLYENRLETNLYEQFTGSGNDTCPTNSSGNFACGTAQGNGLASMLLDLPNAFNVNVPSLGEVHVRMTPIGGFVQDTWHVRSNLTIDVGLRYDYDPAVNLLVSDGETVNAYNYPAKQFIIGSKETAAYSTGCATGGTITPPCVPGGLSASNPAFGICVGGGSATTQSACTTAGGDFYNTLNNITFSNSQPALKAVGDNIGPRVGVAWQFMPKTVLRVGYGIYYDTISYRSQYAENTLQGSVWPWTRGVSDTLNTAYPGAPPSPTVNPICSNGGTCGPYGGYSTSQLGGLIGSLPIVIAPTPWGSTFGGYTNDPSYSDPRSQQWNVQIERQLGASSMFSVAYVGSNTQRLDWCCKINYPQGGPFCENNTKAAFTCPGTPLTPLQIDEKEYLPFAPSLNYAQSTGHSNYNALEAQFQKRFSGGLETLVAYTWSKCLGDANGQFNAENGGEGAPYEYYFNQSLSYGICAYNVPQTLNWSAVYELPFGRDKRWLSHGPLSWILGNWQTNVSMTQHSGQAYNPSWGGAAATVDPSIGGVAPVSTDPANLSNTESSITGYSRPDVVPGCNLQAHQTPNQWFNPTCYVSPASPAVGPGYGFGTSGIGNLRDQWFSNFDASLIKNFKFSESKRLQLRFEGFNVFNHMVLGTPGTSIAPTGTGTTVTYGTAGVVSSIANTPRELQLAAKFIF
ncbi:MAG TPA: TonB-dependent receptor [Candidatus Acidoferrales bacterium]